MDEVTVPRKLEKKAKRINGHDGIFQQCYFGLRGGVFGLPEQFEEFEQKIIYFFTDAKTLGAWDIAPNQNPDFVRRLGPFDDR